MRLRIKTSGTSRRVLEEVTRYWGWGRHACWKVSATMFLLPILLLKPIETAMLAISVSARALIKQGWWGRTAEGLGSGWCSRPNWAMQEPAEVRQVAMGSREREVGVKGAPWH